MSKKALFVLILVMLALFGAGYWYVFMKEEAAPLADVETDETSDLFPFGQGSQTTGSTPSSNATSETGTEIDLSSNSDDAVPHLRQISAFPTAGIVAFSQGSTTVIRYTERATGHISETKSDNTAVTKISNVTIPKVYETLWSADGSRFLARYLREDGDTIRTFYAKVATTTRPEQALEGMFLEDGIKDVLVTGSKIFYFSVNNDGSRGIAANMDGSGKVATFTSTYGDWAVLPAGGNLVTIYSRPSGLSTGAAYSLNTATGAYTKITSDVTGLVALANQDASRAIASGMISRDLATVAFDLKKGTSSTLGVSTIADKCVWSKKNKEIVYCAVPQSVPAGTYPDDWYKGRVSFDDSLWKIDTVTGETDAIMTPELEAGVSMDIYKLSLDQNENVLVFTNKKDMTAWAYKLVE